MSTKAHKATLRAAVLPLLNCGVSESTIGTMIVAVTEACNPNDPTALSLRQVQNTLAAIEHCDTAIAIGPGHQSVLRCQVRGPHTSHSNGRCEWSEAAITKETYRSRSEPDKTYRLAYSNEGWW